MYCLDPPPLCSWALSEEDCASEMKSLWTHLIGVGKWGPSKNPSQSAAIGGALRSNEQCWEQARPNRVPLRGGA